MKPLEVDNCSSERRAHYFLRTKLPDSLISPSVAASVDWTVKGAFKINSDSEFSSKKSQVGLLPRTRHASSSVCVKQSSQWTSTEDLVPTYIPQHCWQWRSEGKVYDHLVMGWLLLSPVNEGWSIFIVQMWNLKSNVISDKSIVSSVASGRFQRFVPLKKKKSGQVHVLPTLHTVLLFFFGWSIIEYVENVQQWQIILVNISWSKQKEESYSDLLKKVKWILLLCGIYKKKGDKTMLNEMLNVY